MASAGHPAAWAFSPVKLETAAPAALVGAAARGEATVKVGQARAAVDRPGEMAQTELLVSLALGDLPAGLAIRAQQAVSAKLACRVR
jgi:hypothetical protein